MSKESFSNRWGIILASLGMAIGAGNLWRFPRLAGEYGGTFIILWIFFLFAWSIPLLLAEFSIGKNFKKGVIGSFGSLAGKNFVWMGFFITVCTLGIAFYYSVVTAWAIRYLWFSVDNLISGASISSMLDQNPDHLSQQWDGVANGSIYTILIYILVVFAGVAVLGRGIQKGLEKANKILIPSLFGLLLVIAAMSLTLPNGLKGLEYMYTIDLSLFSDSRVWIEALSQSAWSTGAGWGLMMTLSSYSREKEDITLNTFVGAFGNNTASLVAGMAIIPAVFALSATEQEALSFLKAGNQSLTFIVIPKLFDGFSGGGVLSIIFFLALFFAAFSSLLPMIELFISNLANAGLSRRMASIIVIIFFVLIGFPSAYSLSFFNNQDWVWGVGLILSGFFILLVTAKYGPDTFKKNFLDRDSDFLVSSIYFKLAVFLNLFIAAFLIYWWLSQGYSQYPWFNEDGIWNVFDTYSNASVITQWILVIVVGVMINRFLYRKFVATKS